MQLATHIPSHPATRPGESARPDLWQGCAGLFAPCLYRGVTDANHTARNFSLPNLGTTRLSLRKSGGGSYFPSPFGGSLKFTGSGGGFIETSNSLTDWSFVQKKAVFTFAALVRSDAVSTFLALADTSNGSSANSGFLLFQNASGQITLQVYRASAGNTTLNITATTALVAGQWTLVVVKCDGANGSIWLNGHRGATDTAVTVLASTDATTALGLGSYSGANTNPWNGQVAYLGIWNRCLPHRAVQELTADPLLMFRRPRRTLGKAPAAGKGRYYYYNLCGGVG